MYFLNLFYRPWLKVNYGRLVKGFNLLLYLKNLSFTKEKGLDSGLSFTLAFL